MSERADSVEAKARSWTKASLITGTPEPQPTIVVIDPVRTTLELISYALGEEGYQVFSFTRVDAAMRYLEGHPADLVLTEVASPWESETFDLAPLLEAAGKTPVLIYTRTPELVSGTLLHLAVISRPSDVDVLLDHVARLLRAGP